MSYRDDFNTTQKEVYWSLPRILGMIAACLVAIFLLGFVATGGDLLTYQFWAPKQENVRRQVFENTQSYVQGKTEYLAKLRFEYQQAEGDHKSALRTLIISEASTVDNSNLPQDLQSFIRSLQ